MLHVIGRDVRQTRARGSAFYRWRCSCGDVGKWHAGRGGKHDASREGLEHMVAAGRVARGEAEQEQRR